MANIKISELSEITQIPANTENLLLVVTDMSQLVPVSRKIKFSMMYDYIDNLGLAAYNNSNVAFTKSNSAYDQANTATENAATADQKAVTSGDYANSAYDLANTTTILSQSAFNRVNTVSIFATSSFDQANLAFNLASNVEIDLANSDIYANNAFAKANLAYTLSTTSNANSLIVVTSTPVTNKGNTGDVKNMVAFTNTAFYYCTANYDGTTNIWSKIVSTDSW